MDTPEQINADLGDLGLRVVLVVALSSLIGKLLLLHRFAGCHGAKTRSWSPQEELDRLLPFQRRTSSGSGVRCSLDDSTTEHGWSSSPAAGGRASRF
ncbi:MAG: hypothetical protein ACRDYA_10120 [Egibacteraceae bacterium]